METEMNNKRIEQLRLGTEWKIRKKIEIIESALCARCHLANNGRTADQNQRECIENKVILCLRGIIDPY